MIDAPGANGRGARSRCALAFVPLLLLALSAGTARAQNGAPTVDLAAVILDAEVAEISGMAPSRRHDDVFWAINDSDNGARLFAIDTAGRVRSAYDVSGAANIDWEDLASFELDDKPYVLIADTGDNGGLRKQLQLIVVPEPEVRDTQYRGAVTPAWTVRFRWPDGPRDCEAVAVDAVNREILLFAKKRVPAQVFRLPLDPPKRRRQLQIPVQVAQVHHIPQPDTAELAAHPQSGRYRAQITAADVSPNGLALVLLTYRDGYLYLRAPGESWLDALTRPPRLLGLPPMVQAEAIAFDRRGGAIFATSEKLPAPLIRIRNLPSR